MSEPMVTYTMTIRAGGKYGVLTKKGGESVPIIVSRPNEVSMLVVTVPPPSPTITEAMDRTLLLALGEAQQAEAAQAQVETEAIEAPPTGEDD